MSCLRRVSMGLVVNVLLLAGVGVAEGDGGAVEVGVKVEQVSLFKNGLGFFEARATVPGGETAFRMRPMGAAVHGTFWLGYGRGVDMAGVVAREVDVEKMLPALTVQELIKANVGKTAELTIGNETIVGKIVSFAEQPEAVEPDPYGPGRGGQMGRGYNYGQANLVVVETEEGTVALNAGSVGRVKFADETPRLELTSGKKEMQLEVQLNAPAEGEELGLSYLAKGITWAPSYMVDISDGGRAMVSAKAVVINEIGDLEDMTLQLVTGYPHLQFGDIVSPMALKENLAGFLAALGRGHSRLGGSDPRSNVMRQVDLSMSSEGRSRAMPEYGAAKAGQVAEDLFLYPVEDVTLRKGEVGYYPLFSESVPYKHVYRWKIPDYVNKYDQYYDRHDRAAEEKEEEVWHCVRLENKTPVPWTTAPAETVKGSFILGQDTLEYTPVGGEATLRITRAMSVAAEQGERETDRKRDALRMYGDHFDLVTVKGELSVKNYLPKRVTMEISKTLSGELQESEEGPGPKVKKLAKGLKRMNGVSELTWEIKLGPGEQKKLGYVYEVYVRR